ncbi:MAG: GNAT family N-acetyltransferase [Bacteroidia bacterium]
MKICIAQTRSLKGRINKNIEHHLQMVERAVIHHADLIVFPELSITNYEPKLANELATDASDPVFEPLQELANRHLICIGVGMPTRAKDGVHISMLIFKPKAAPTVYCKQMLHDDELPYFVCGQRQTILDFKGTKIGFGICYETLQREHFANAKKLGADIYIASVAKPKGGVEKAYKHFPKMAAEFNTPILMSNCIGPCDNFIGTGQSAVWSENGEILAQLDGENEGLLVYDSNTIQVEKEQHKIEKGNSNDLDRLFNIYLKGKADLEQKGIFQWTNNYPTRSIIQSDIENGVLYVLKNGLEILGAINISEEQEPEYEQVTWAFNSTKILVIHRLVIDPKYQNNGYARMLMDFAEDYALENQYTSIRLDAYTQNKRVLKFYEKRQYFIRGSVNFPGREYPFYCLEKEIKTFRP